jgi:plasmid maintenance system antidote protein VapI
MKSGEIKKGNVVTVANIRIIATVWRKTQNEMAEILGITRGVYAHIVNMNADIDVDTIVRLAQLTGVTVERLRLIEISMYEIPSAPLREKKTVIRRVDRLISQLSSLVNQPMSV